MDRVTKEVSRPGLRVVAAFDGAKGGLVLPTGFGLLAFIHRGLHDAAEELVRHPHLNPARHYPRIFLDAGSLVIYVCVASILYLVPFYLIQGRGLSASKAGIIMTARFLAMCLTAPVSGMISDRVGPRAPASAGMALMAGGLFLFSAVNGATPLYLVAISMTVTGVGVATFVTPNNSAMLEAAPAGRKGIAAGMMAPAGVVLSASRGDGNVTGRPPRNPSLPTFPRRSRKT